MIPINENFISQHILGDCFDVLRNIPDNSIDLVLTDPPYEISQDNDGMPGGCWGKPGDKGYMKRPELDFGEWDKTPLDLSTLFSELYRIETFWNCYLLLRHLEDHSIEGSFITIQSTSLMYMAKD